MTGNAYEPGGNPDTRQLNQTAADGNPGTRQLNRAATGGNPDASRLNQAARRQLRRLPTEPGARRRQPQHPTVIPAKEGIQRFHGE